MGTRNTEPCMGTSSSASLLQTFKAWRKTRVLSPQRKREKSNNQWLLRRCLKIPTLRRDSQPGIQTHGAVSQSTVSEGPPPQRDLLQGIQTHATDSQIVVSQGPPLISSCKSDILSDMDIEPFPHCMVNPSRLQGTRQDGVPMIHVMAERRRRVLLSESFVALRKSMPVTSKSKSDKLSILGDAITYLEDLKREIHRLEASKSRVERQYEDLKLSHEALEQRVQQLDASKSLVERPYEDLKLSHQDLGRQLEVISGSKDESREESGEARV